MPDAAYILFLKTLTKSWQKYPLDAHKGILKFNQVDKNWTKTYGMKDMFITRMYQTIANGIQTFIQDNFETIKPLWRIFTANLFSFWKYSFESRTSLFFDFLVRVWDLIWTLADILTWHTVVNYVNWFIVWVLCYQSIWPKENCYFSMTTMRFLKDCHFCFTVQMFILNNKFWSLMLAHSKKIISQYSSIFYNKIFIIIIITQHSNPYNVIFP